MKYKKQPSQGEPANPLGRKIEDVLPKVMKGIQKTMHSKPKDIQGLWSELAGPKYAPYTLVEKIENKTLYIKVRNALVLQHLVMHEKVKILKALKAKVGSGVIDGIVFRR